MILPFKLELTFLRRGSFVVDSSWVLYLFCRQHCEPCLCAEPAFEISYHKNKKFIFINGDYKKRW